MGSSSGRPIQLIRIERDGQISVGEEALDIISSYNEPVGFVSLAGKTRTGKSCLLNRLLHIRGEGVRIVLSSFESIRQLRVALKAFGCGLTLLETISTTISSFS